MLQPILWYSLKARAEPVDAFVAEYPCPVFLVESACEELEDSFDTAVQNGIGGAIGFSVAEIKKREGANAFGMMITIGRARNNDIYLPNSQVSKFHAYVALGEGEVKITDAGSRTGTVVEGRKIEPSSEKAVLKNGEKALLGGVQLTYYDPPAFYSYLQTMSA